MKYQIIVRYLAERDLEEAEDWYNEQQSGLGIEFRETISDLFRVSPKTQESTRECMVTFIERCYVDSLTSHTF